MYINQIKHLNKETGVGLIECHRAFCESDGIYELFLWYIKKMNQ